MPGGILALDPSTRVIGYAYADTGNPQPVWGHKAVRFGEETAKEDAGKIGVRVGLFLEVMIDLYRPSYIVREQPYAGGGQVPANFETLFALLGVAWQIDTIAEQHEVECRQCTSYAAVKYFTGRGKYEGISAEQRRKAKKRATIATCKLHGWTCTEDEADALAILCYAEARLFPEMRLSMKRPAGPLFSAAVKEV